MFRFVDEIQKKNTSYVSLIISALFAGLAFHSYYPGRLFFLLPALWIFLQTQKRYAIMFLAVVGIVIAPLVIYNLQHPDVRVSQISFLSDPKISLDYKVKGVWNNIVSTLLMPFWKGDMNGRHNFPGKSALNPILAILFLVGLLQFCFNNSSSPRKRESINPSIFFLGYFIISLVPTILTAPSDNPNMLRTFTMIPAIIYFIGIGVQYIFDKSPKFIYSKSVTFIFLFLILVSSLYELRTYFMFQSRVFNNSFEVNCPLKNVVDKPIVPKECRLQKNMF